MGSAPWNRFFSRDEWAVISNRCSTSVSLTPSRSHMGCGATWWEGQRSGWCSWGEHSVVYSERIPPSLLTDEGNWIRLDSMLMQRFSPRSSSSAVQKSSSKSAGEQEQARSDFLFSNQIRAALKCDSGHMVWGWRSCCCSFLSSQTVSSPH